MRALFLTRLTVEQVEEELWMVVKPLQVEFTPSLTACDGQDIPILTVPTGFTTDFASVPRIFFAYLIAGGIGELAATVHDYLYRTGLAPRRTADNAFLACLVASKVPAWRRQLMYRAVLWCGAKHYKGVEP